MVKTMQKNILSALLISLLLGYSSTNSAATAQPSDSKKGIYDATLLDWHVWCYRPNVWRMNFNFEQLTGSWAEHANIPINLPGSIQQALKSAGIIEDWNIGLNHTKIEWIENRHWLIGAKVPDEWFRVNQDEQLFIECKGLDQKGILMVNGQEAGRFENTFIPYKFLISPFLKESNNNILFLFETPPENLAQIGWTSKIKDWKPRFYYGWDWIPRILQTGIWDKVLIHRVNDNQPMFENLKVVATADKLKDLGSVTITAMPNRYALSQRIQVHLTDEEGKSVFEDTFRAAEAINGKCWDNLDVKRWWPNGAGEQQLYKLQITLIDEQGNKLQQETRRIGFRQIDWSHTKGAPIDADPWLCSVNNQPIFLQGINWTPIRPNFADLQYDDYARLLKLYRDGGINTIRIWGGGFPEKDWLYDLCDEMGILIWQDFPLSSSGLDNYPPEDLKLVDEIRQIVTHYVKRLHHHPSLLLWCGGNELYEMGDVAPVTDKHIMVKAMKDVVSLLDPARRFLSGSPSGPKISVDMNLVGKGVHWDVHGPWKLPFSATDQTMKAVEEYWSKDDAMFRSEVGVPGAMSLETMQKYNGGLQLLPASMENPLWRNVSWWIEWDEYITSGGNSSEINAYIKWSQERQTKGLTMALKKNKDRFPACGGFIIWMGHDSFPCMINTSLVDFDGHPKPVFRELSRIWKENAYMKEKH
jgi:beta-mannosidase